MLQLSDADDPIGQKKARELLSREPKVARHTKAWVDDSELCLEVECELNDGSSILVEMNYCWSTCGGQAPWETTPYYFMTVVEWLLNNQWLEFYRWVQVQFDRALAYQASNDYFAEYDMPELAERAAGVEPGAAPDPARDVGSGSS